MTGNFYFDNISAETLGVTSVNINNSDDIMPVFGGQTPVMQQVIEHDHSTFIRTRKDNLRLTMFFTLVNDIRGDALTPERLRTLGKFFARSVPIELKVEEDMTKAIRVIPTSSIEVVRFGGMRGFFQITFLATTPYWMSPLEILTFVRTAGGTISVNNGRNIHDRFGNYDIYPRLRIHNIQTSNSPHFVLRNVTSGSVVRFNNVRTNDIITMHHRIIESRLEELIFQRWNKTPFYLTEGINTLTVNNDCTIDIHMQYPIF